MLQLELCVTKRSKPSSWRPVLVLFRAVRRQRKLFGARLPLAGNSRQGNDEAAPTVALSRLLAGDVQQLASRQRNLR